MVQHNSILVLHRRSLRTFPRASCSAIVRGGGITMTNAEVAKLLDTDEATVEGCIDELGLTQNEIDPDDLDDLDDLLDDGDEDE
jgi:hypothetical protein